MGYIFILIFFHLFVSVPLVLCALLMMSAAPCTQCLKAQKKLWWRYIINFNRLTSLWKNQFRMLYIIWECLNSSVTSLQNKSFLWSVHFYGVSVGSLNTIRSFESSNEVFMHPRHTFSPVNGCLISLWMFFWLRWFFLFYQKLRAVVASNKDFSRYFRAQSNYFTITHYAGNVSDA